MKSDNAPSRMLAMSKLCNLGVFTTDQLDAVTGYQPSAPPAAAPPSPEAARQGLKVVHSESPPGDHNFEAENLLIGASLLRPKLHPAILAAAPPASYHARTSKEVDPAHRPAPRTGEAHRRSDHQRLHHA